MEETNTQVIDTSGDEPIVTQSQNDAPIETTPESKVETKTPEATDDDFSWVPKKFLRDGKPDFKAIETARANLEKKLSGKGVVVAPDTPDEYTYQFESLPVDPVARSEFQQEALDAGLSVDQYTFIMQKYEQEFGKYVHTAEKAEKTLRADWGDDYAANMQLANRAFEEYVPSDVSLEDIGNNPAVIKILARIGAELKEDSAPPRGGKSGGMTQEEVEALMMTPEYSDPRSDTYKKVTDWFKRNPG